MSCGQPRCLRAPRGEEDCLGGEQVAAYLALLRPADLAELNSPVLDERAKREGQARATTGQFLEGTALQETVLASLAEGPATVRQSLAWEFAEPASLRHAVAAYAARRERQGQNAGGGGRGIPCSEVLAFVRFAVAYRVHCYLQTSFLPQGTQKVGIDQPKLQQAASQETRTTEVVFAIGGPGAGKSTQCPRISKVFGLRHLRLIDLLLAEYTPATVNSTADVIAVALQAPAEQVVQILWRAMQDRGLGNRYLIDGFPRDVPDWEAWERLVSSKARVVCGLFFDASESVRAARLVDRGGDAGVARSWVCDISGLLQQSAVRGWLRRVAAEGGVEEVWRSVQGILGPKVVFILGSPGAGKGTQCLRIAEAFGYTHLSVGELLRAESHRDPEIMRYLEEGKLVPTMKVVALLRREMEQHGWQGKRYLIDGFPRSLANLEAWNASIQGRACVKLCLHLHCSQAIGEARKLEFGRTSGRADDNIETIRKRFVSWYHNSQPVLQKFKDEGLLRVVDAERGVEAVWEDVQELFGPSVIFVLGGPGAGKGTQCSRISDSFGYQHLSTGDLLREELAHENSPVRKIVEEHVRLGRLVPDEIVLRLVQRAMERRGWEGGKYLVDGFPRSFDNLTAWREILGHKVAVKGAIFFDCAEAVMERRLLNKRDKLSDDTPEAIATRLQVFRSESLPVVRKLEADGLLRRIDSSKDAEAVWTDVKRLFGPEVVILLGVPHGARMLFSRICETFGFQHIRLDDLLEEEPGASTPEAEVRLLQRAMEERGWQGGQYVLDGFPREMSRLDAWKRLLAPRLTLRVVLAFEETSQAGPGANEAPSAEVVRSFESEGVLCKVCADQDPEAIWSCVQEALRYELDTQIKNHAVVLVKQKASSPDTDRFVQSVLASHGVAVVKTGTIPTEEVLSRGIFEAAFAEILEPATGKPQDQRVSAKGRRRFKEAAGEEWDQAAANGRLVSASQAQETLGLEALALREAWDGKDVVRIRVEQYLTVARMTGRKGEALWVINGFAPQWKEAFVQSTRKGDRRVRWFCVEFSPAEVPWQRFASEVIGCLDPSAALPDSIRGQFMQHWRTLGLEEVPDILDNCVHASGGPLEGLQDYLLWSQGALQDHPLARSLLAGGVSKEMLEAWLKNPCVDDWPIGAETCSGTLFACSQECDHAVFRRSALSYAARVRDVCPLKLWALRARTEDEAQPQNTVAVKTGGKSKLETMTLLHFNDVYNVEARKAEPVGGISRFVTRVRELKAEAVARGEDALCAFSGDAFNPSLTSTITKGRHMVTALNAVGIDVGCYGNHDFDFGSDELVEMAAASNFPWLISNVVEKATGVGPANGRVTRMMDWYGRKIGFMGLVEREWLATLNTIQPEDIIYEDFCQCGRRLARQLREDGAELVLALTHMRVPNDELLAHEVEEIDIILGGHDHHYDVKPVGPFGTYVLKSGTDFRDLTVLRLRFTGGKGPKAFEVLETRHVEIDSSIAEDEEMKELVQECETKVGTAMEEVLGHSAVDLDCRFSSVRTRETNVGNFITDVMRIGLKADLAVINGGALRADSVIEQGPFKVRDLLSILPMLDELCLLELSGSQVLGLLQNSVSQYPKLEGRFLQVSGVAFAFDASKPAGHRLDESSVTIAGKALEATERYRVGTLNYLRKGKDGFDMLSGAMCLADGEQAGILPTLVRDHLHNLSALNGMTPTCSAYRVKLASLRVDRSHLSPVGAGPAPLQQLGIRPEVEGRITCVNGVGE